MKPQLGLRKLAATCALLSVAIILGLGTWIERASAQQAPASDLEVVQLRPNVYVIGGAGGNVVVQTGPEGVILVDIDDAGMRDTGDASNSSTCAFASQPHVIPSPVGRARSSRANARSTS